MARSMTLLRYELVSYWRRAFSIRGKYDSSSIFLIIIIFAFFYAYFSILKSTAQALSVNNTQNLNLLLGVVFFVWLLPASESLSLLAQRNKILFLPLKKIHFLTNHLLTIFLVPTSVFAAIITLAAIYPLAFAAHPFAAAAAFIFFVIIAVFINFSFVSLLKNRIFRIIAFLFCLISVSLFITGTIIFQFNNPYLPTEIFARIINGQSGFADFVLMFFYSLVALLSAVFSAGRTLEVSSETNKKNGFSVLDRFNLPVKYAGLLKKDIIYSWKLPDCYLSLLLTLACGVALIAFEGISFQMFNGFVVFAAMLSGSLAFNIFGLETLESIERYELLPLTAGEIIKTKNSAFASVVFTQTFFLFPLIFWRFGAVYFIVSMIKIASITLIYAAWGNVLSIKHPFKMYFYQFSFGGSLPDMLAGVLVISLTAIFSEVFTAESLAAKLLVNILINLICIGLYSLSLNWSARALPSEWERIRLAIA
jgi:hypothetical protein